MRISIKSGVAGFDALSTARLGADSADGEPQQLADMRKEPWETMAADPGAVRASFDGWLSRKPAGTSVRWPLKVQLEGGQVIQSFVHSDAVVGALSELAGSGDAEQARARLTGLAAAGGAHTGWRGHRAV